MIADDPLYSCTASQLIAELQRLINEHGDLQVFTEDADTSWTLPIGIAWEPPTGRGLPARFEIKSEYHGRPTHADFYPPPSQRTSE